MTGLRPGQLTELAVRVAAGIGDVVRPGGAPAVIGLYKSVAMVVTLIRTNLTQEVAGDIFGCSQATVSRRWDLLRPVIGRVLADCIAEPVGGAEPGELVDRLVVDLEAVLAGCGAGSWPGRARRRSGRVMRRPGRGG